MRSIFSSIMAASLLIHAAFGCCWHHGHEVAAEDHSNFGQSLAAESEHAHADALVGCETHHCDAPHSPDEGHSNCQGTCHYLPAQKTQLDSCSAFALLDLALVTTTTIEVPTIAASSFALALAEPARPAVRLHLFQQLLLI